MITGRGFVWFRRLGLLFLSLIVVVPLYAMGLIAFVPTGDLDLPFRWFPDRLSLEAFDAMWTTVPLASYLANSVLIAACSTVLVMLIGVPASYALARLPFVGRRALAVTLVASQAVSGLLFLVPMYLMLAQVGRWMEVELIGSTPVLILVCTVFALPFGVGLLVAHFASMSAESEESAWSLGASPVTTLVRVVLPAARPTLAVVALFGCAVAWGEVMFVSMLSDVDTRTVAVGLAEYSSESSALWNQLLAAALTSSIPLVVAFVVLRKHIVIGFAALVGGEGGRA